MTTSILARLALAATMASALSVQAAVSVLHDFDGGATGERPQATPTFDGGALYGVAVEGGAFGSGVLYRYTIEDAQFASLHDFDALADPFGTGSFPSGSPLVIGSQLYGTAEFGGAGFDGVLYQIGHDGAGYTLLHEFDGAVASAASPVGGVVTAGSTLFGSTLFGSAQSAGAIYSIDADGSGFTVLHDLEADGSQGEEPPSVPTFVDSELWGIASLGGDFDGGTLYRLSLEEPEAGEATTHASFSVEHHFGALETDGRTPVGDLLLHDGWLYGVAQGGGAEGLGGLFRFGVDGQGYESIYDFAGGPNDGDQPADSLIVVDGRLYGVTRRGGPTDAGVVYSVGLDGSDWRLEHAFSGLDGRAPEAGLAYDGTSLFGVTSQGGANDSGVLFSLDPNALRGDFNGDGLVDAADYTVWRDTLDSVTDLRADGDFSGVVDAADHAVWAANYGLGVGSSTAVPEPTALACLLAGLAAATWRRR